MGFFNTLSQKAKGTVRKMFQGYYSQVLQIPPDLNTQDYLIQYGKIGWLFACTSRIANDVADTEWKAYRKGEEDSLNNSKALELLENPNPYFSKFRTLELTQMYLDLVGKCFWYIAKDRAGRPAQIWVVSPLNMTIIPDTNKFIKGFVYQAGAQRVPLSTDEVIMFSYQDPSNPYNGVSPAKAAAIALESDKFASQWNRNFFYNNAEPQGIVSFPDGVEEDDFNAWIAKWQDKYGGVGNAKKTAFIRGGQVSYTAIQISQRDMDFYNLRLNNRDEILAIFGVPKSVLGIVEDVNRASAEASEYTYMKHTISPKNRRIQDILNNEYVQLFNEDVELRPNNVVPEDKEFIKTVVEGQTDKSITKNEARNILNKLLGCKLEPLPGGDVIYQPVSMQPMGTALSTQQTAPKEEKPIEDTPKDSQSTKSLKKNGFSKTVRKKIARQIEKNNKTRQEDFIKLAEPLKNEFNKVIANYFNDMQKDVVSKILDGSKEPVDIKKWNKELQDRVVGLYVKCFKVGGQSVVNEFKAISNYIHKDTGVQFDVKDPKVQAKIKNKVSKITEVNDSTKDRVKDIIEEMCSSDEGFTIRDIAKRIESDDFYEFSKDRANCIAQTETMTSLNQATIEGYKQNSDLIDGKAWLPSYHNTRQSHLDAGTEYSTDTPISVDEPFNVGGYDCECPGDDSLPASEVVNCACCMSPVVKVDDENNSENNDSNDRNSDIMSMNLQLFSQSFKDVIDEKISNGLLSKSEVDASISYWNDNIKEKIETPIGDIKPTTDRYYHVIDGHPEFLDKKEIDNIFSTLESPDVIYKVKLGRAGYVKNINGKDILVIAKDKVITAYYPSDNYLKKIKGGEIIWEKE